MIHPWRSEAVLLGGGLAAALLIGWLEECIPGAMGILFLAYLARHLYYVRDLLVWLCKRESELPDGTGVWVEIFHRLRLKQRRHQRRRRRLGKILKRFRQAIQALPDATVVLTGDFEIEWFNRAAAHLLGLERRDAGLRIDNLLRYPGFVTHLEERRFDTPITLPAPGNERVQLEIRLVPYTTNRYLLLARDVSQLRLLERQRRDFVAHVSHELRTPLTVLKGYLETLMDNEGSISQTSRPLLERMDEQIHRLQYLIDDLLYLSRLETTRSEPGHQQAVDTPRLIEDICQQIDHFQERHATLIVKIDSGARLTGNEQELRSAFTNLVINAVKYTPASGTVTVRWYETGKDACLEVIDTGKGIPAEDIPRLTERFYRVSGSETLNPTGTGLGLAIVKHVLNRNHGRLEIESELGKGSVFRCCFPRHRIGQEYQGAKAFRHPPPKPPSRRP